MRKRSIVLLTVIAAVASATEAAELRGQDAPTIAVMDFNSFMMGQGGASVELGKAISAMLVTEFSGRDGLRVVERQRLLDLIQEQDLNYSGRVEEAIEVGKMLGVQYVMLGQVTSIVDNLRMDIRAVDVETSEVLSVHKKSDKTSELFQVVVDLADEFGTQLDLTPPSGRPEMEPIPVRATIEFSRAVDFEDKGEIELAIQHYEATLEIHPSHRDARRALDRLRGGIQT